MSAERPWRLFVAADVPANVRAAVAAAAAPLRQRWPQLRWIEPDAWHITVVFLGHVAADAVPALADAFSAACAGAAPTQVALRPVAGRTRSGVLWVELERCEALTAVAAALAAAASEHGVTVEERPFRGHLTLGWE